MCGENDDQFSSPFRSHVHVELLDIFQIKTISTDNELEIDGVFKFNAQTPARATAWPLGVERI